MVLQGAAVGRGWSPQPVSSGWCGQASVVGPPPQHQANRHPDTRLCPASSVPTPSSCLTLETGGAAANQLAPAPGILPQ